jgi:hypothetical protein
MPLTKDDIYAIRNADTLAIHLGHDHRDNGQGLVRFIKRKPYNAKPFDEDKEYVLTNCKVVMETYNGQRALETGRAKCFGYVSIYHDQRTPQSSILKTLKVDDEITFSFYPDAHSNEYVRKAGLHADALYLHVRRNGKRQTWELETSICPDNSARMCHGVPDNESHSH